MARFVAFTRLFGGATMDMKLEVVGVPDSDVDRARSWYAQYMLDEQRVQPDQHADGAGT
jgi:hypothetical protein